MGELPIRTFVIGVFQAGDTGSVNNVNAIAQAGGTSQGVFIDTEGEVETEFVEALRAIRSGTLACQFQIPASETALDYFRVNLEFDDGSTKRQLSFVRDEAGCAAMGVATRVEAANKAAVARRVMGILLFGFRADSSGVDRQSKAVAPRGMVPVLPGLRPRCLPQRSTWPKSRP